MSKGIDYGMGRVNIDVETGIRYGVISQNEVLQAWCDEAEPDYGEPCCPNCGGVGMSEDIEGNFACPSCGHVCQDDALPLEPLGFSYRQEGYEAYCGDSGDIFITKSPYYTHAAYCSPCAPGACYLTSPCEDGDRAYCFGPDWFEAKPSYPVYSVATGKKVTT